jgi:hypothetical protein
MQPPLPNNHRHAHHDPCARCGQDEPGEAASTTPDYWICTPCRQARAAADD